MSDTAFICAALRYGTSLFVPFALLHADINAQQNTENNAIEEIIVVADHHADDPTMIKADAASLIATPGDVNDPLKALLSLPGITFGGGDLDEPVIRGAGPDDNLFLVDDVPVDNVFHELSDSIFSSNVIRTFDLHTAAYDASYGNAVGGVIDIGLRDPSKEDTILKVDLSQLKSGVLIEAPITENSSFYASYRHNLAHLFLKNFERGDDVLIFKMPESRDYTARYQWRGNGHDLTLTAFGAWDKTEEVQNDELDAPQIFGETKVRKFNAQSLRFRSDMNDTAHFSTTLSHTDSKRITTFVNGEFSSIKTKTLAMRSRYEQHLGDKHALTVGLNVKNDDANLTFKGRLQQCDFFSVTCGIAFSATPEMITENYTNGELYIADTFTPNDILTVTAGLHIAQDFFLDEFFIEPRLNIDVQVNEKLAVYARGGLHHKRPNIDRLLLINSIAKNQQNETSHQIALGQRWNISDAWRLQTEVYYKTFNILDFATTPLELDIEGSAYGIDVLLAKPISENLYGWLAVSYSESNRTRKDTGQTFNYEFHAPLSATIALNYTFGNGWRIGTKWRVQSGTPYTPLETIILDPTTGLPVLAFGDPFSERLKTYYRLDLRLEKQSEYSFGDVTYYLDILNVTDQKNISNRDYPLRNTFLDSSDNLSIRPDDDEGIPFFIGAGVSLSF